MITVSEILESVNDAEAQLRRVSMNANLFARLLLKVLRLVDPSQLKELKHELRNFDAHQLKWK